VNSKHNTISPLGSTIQHPAKKQIKPCEFSVKPQLRSNQIDLNSFYDTYTKLGEITTRMQSISSNKYLDNSRSPVTSQSFILNAEKKVKKEPASEQKLPAQVAFLESQRSRLNFATVTEAVEEDTNRAIKSPFMASSHD
jgi:hypothetical protein